MHVLWSSNVMTMLVSAKTELDLLRGVHGGWERGGGGGVGGVGPNTATLQKNKRNTARW